MSVVYAKQTASIAWSAGKTVLKKDQAWDADSPLVQERPDLFSDEPTNVAGRSRSVGAAPVIERATRAPGEVREVGKKPRKAADAADAADGGADGK